MTALLEARIEKLERQKIVLSERVETTVPPKGRQKQYIELALKFLANPWNIYINGDFALRRTVLRLVFSEPLKYGQNGTYGTPELSFPFKYLAGLSGSKSEMVRLEGDSLNSLIDALQEWEYHLARLDSKSLRCENDPFAP